MKGLYDACHDDPWRIADAILDRCHRMHTAHCVFIADDGDLQITPACRAKVEGREPELVGTFDRTSERAAIVEAIRDRTWGVLVRRLGRAA